MKITIETYNPKWPAAFKKESNLLTDSIQYQSIKIEHIGSTSIQGLGAKPVIDIMIGLVDFNSANNFIASIESLGYTYISEYENTMPDRRFFTKVVNLKKSHHIHMVQHESEFWNRHLKFRDYLRANNEARDQYMALKINLAKIEWTNENEYASAKTDFIRAIEKRIL